MSVVRGCWIHRERSAAPGTARGLPGAARAAGHLGLGHWAARAGRAEAPGLGPAPPASPPGQRPHQSRNLGLCRRRSRRLFSLGAAVAAAAPAPASLWGHGVEQRWPRGTPADAPPADSRATPPRGDEARAVKMEVTCLLLLALIPFHCRGQGVYGKSPPPAPRCLGPARKLYKRRKVRACRDLVETSARTREWVPASPPSPGRGETELAVSEYRHGAWGLAGEAGVGGSASERNPFFHTLLREYVTWGP